MDVESPTNLSGEFLIYNAEGIWILHGVGDNTYLTARRIEVKVRENFIVNLRMNCIEYSTDICTTLLSNLVFLEDTFRDNKPVVLTEGL